MDEAPKVMLFDGWDFIPVTFESREVKAQPLPASLQTAINPRPGNAELGRAESGEKTPAVSF